MVLITIVRRLLGDIKWSLLASALAFLGLALLWNWPISLYEFPPPTLEDEDDPARSASTATNDPTEPEAEAEAEDANSDTDAESPAEEDAQLAALTEDGAPQPVDEADQQDDEDQDEDEPRRRRRTRSRGPGLFVAFGVPGNRFFDPDDPPTLLMQVAFFNHPLILLTILGWAIGRGSGAVAGEIERGTLDLTMSRPVRRSTYLAAQIAATIIVMAILGLAILAGHALAPAIHPLTNVPGPTDYLPAILMLGLMGLAVFGYTLAASAFDLSRVRAAIVGFGITVGGIAGLITARLVDRYDWLANLSIFHYYAPVGITDAWAREQTQNLLILLGVFAAGSLLAFVGYLRRDLPTSGG